MERKKKIDDVFKSELGSYTETPPPAVWEALEERLDAVPKPRGPLGWVTYLAILLVLITATIWIATGLTGSKDRLAQQTTAEHNTTTAGTPAGNTGNDAPNTDIKGNVPANNNTSPANTTNNDNNTTTTANTPTTGPNRVSNAKPAVYTSTGAPIPASPGSSSNNSTPNGKEAASHSTGKPSRNEAPTGHKVTKPGGNKGTRTKGNNKSKPTDKNNKSPYGTYAAADDNADNSNNQNGYNSSTTQGNNDAHTNGTKQDESATQSNNIKDEGTAGTNHPAPQQDKKDDPAKLAPNDVPKQKKPKAKFDRFEAGVKAGYEQGFSADAAQKAVLAPFLQYRVSKKLGIMLQPAVKYANASSRQIGDATSYYRADEGKNTITSIDPWTIVTQDSAVVIAGYQYNYVFSQKHDSIVKSNWTGGRYFEFEMPVLAKYYVANNFSFYGGVNVVYSKLTGLSERTYIESGIERNAILRSSPLPSSTIPASNLAHPDYQYSGINYNQYTGPQFPAPTAGTFRIGYMAGFSWEFEDRWLIDALVQQTFIKPNMQAGFNVNTPLAAPYIRFTLGYKIIK